MSKPNSAPPHCRHLFSLHLSEIEALENAQFSKNHSGPPVAGLKNAKGHFRRQPQSQ